MFFFFLQAKKAVRNFILFHLLFLKLLLLHVCFMRTQEMTWSGPCVEQDQNIFLMFGLNPPQLHVPIQRLVFFPPHGCTPTTVLKQNRREQLKFKGIMLQGRNFH